jgi:predicted small lipoprotein YifL
MNSLSVVIADRISCVLGFTTMLDHFDTAVRAARVVAFVVTAAVIAGCGIKGPLRPATPPAPASAPATPEASVPAPAPDQDPAAPRKP